MNLGLASGSIAPDYYKVTFPSGLEARALASRRPGAPADVLGADRRRALCDE